MINAVFIDYMGTTVDEHSPEMAEIVRRICKNSGVHDPKQVQRFILDNRRRYESDSYLESYLTEDEIVDRLISDMEAQIGLTEAPAILQDLIRRHWVNALVFPDALTFFQRCPVPVYISSPTTAFPTWSGPWGRTAWTLRGWSARTRSGPTNPIGRFSTRLCGAPDAPRRRHSTSGIPSIPTWPGRGRQASGPSCSSGGGRAAKVWKP